MEANRFLLCAITAPNFVENESAKISYVLDAGFDWVHLRKPNFSADRLAELIESIPTEYHHRLRLHDHYELMERYSIGGIQLNARNGSAPKGDVSISRSCHSLDEATSFQHLDYVTLSPIFDSISKSGYNSRFDLGSLKIGTNVVALGGVTPDHFDELKRIGFKGAALLGYLGWELPLDQFKQHITQIVKCSNL